MKVEQLIPMGRKAGKRLRKALPKTMDVIQSRIERIGSDVADRVKTVSSSAAVARARKAVRRGTDETVKWVRKNPKALPLLGLGGALVTTFLLLRGRRKPQKTKLFKGAMNMMGTVPLFKKGFGFGLGRLLSWAMTPRKPHVFRAISIRW